MPITFSVITDNREGSLAAANVGQDTVRDAVNVAVSTNPPPTVHCTENGKTLKGAAFYSIVHDS
jgi:hypothetical protein